MRTVPLCRSRMFFLWVQNRNCYCQRCLSFIVYFLQFAVYILLFPICTSLFSRYVCRLDIWYLVIVYYLLFIIFTIWQLFFFILIVYCIYYPAIFYFFFIFCFSHFIFSQGIEGGSCVLKVIWTTISKYGIFLCIQNTVQDKLALTHIKWNHFRCV